MRRDKKRIKSRLAGRPASRWAGDLDSGATLAQAELVKARALVEEQPKQAYQVEEIGTEGRTLATLRIQLVATDQMLVGEADQGRLLASGERNWAEAIAGRDTLSAAGEGIRWDNCCE